MSTTGGDRVQNWQVDWDASWENQPVRDLYEEDKEQYLGLVDGEGI